MQSSVFWNITPCNLVKVNRHFEGTYRLHLHSQLVSQATNNMKQLSACCLLPALFFDLLFYPEYEGDVFLRNFASISPNYTAFYPRS
jgi:hypothetical protein